MVSMISSRTSNGQSKTKFVKINEAHQNVISKIISGFRTRHSNIKFAQITTSSAISHQYDRQQNYRGTRDIKFAQITTSSAGDISQDTST